MPVMVTVRLLPGRQESKVAVGLNLTDSENIGVINRKIGKLEGGVGPACVYVLAHALD